MFCHLKSESLHILDSRLAVLAVEFSFVRPRGLPVSCAFVINADILTAGISEVVI